MVEYRMDEKDILIQYEAYLEIVDGITREKQIAGSSEENQTQAKQAFKRKTRVDEFFGENGPHLLNWGAGIAAAIVIYKLARKYLSNFYSLKGT